MTQVMKLRLSGRSSLHRVEESVAQRSLTSVANNHQRFLHSTSNTSKSITRSALYAFQDKHRHSTESSTSLLGKSTRSASKKTHVSSHVLHASATGERLSFDLDDEDEDEDDDLLDDDEDLDEDEEYFRSHSRGIQYDRDSGAVIIGDRKFISRSDLTMYFSHLLHSTHLNAPISDKHKEELLQMLETGHPDPENKIGPLGVQAIIVGMHPKHNTNCFFLQRPDGSLEDFSYRKCVDGIVDRFNLKFFSPMSPGAKIGTLALQKLINQGLQGEQEAWQIYNDMVDRGVANEYHSTVMLKTCGGDQQREMLEAMRASGIIPTVATYTTMVATLVLEGRQDKADALVAEMRELGVEPDNRTTEALVGFDLPMRRLKELTRYQSRRETGAKQAWALFESMLQGAAVETVHMNAMLRLCKGAKQQQALVKRVREQARVLPDLYTFTVLINQLVLEGRVSEAEELASSEAGGEEQTECLMNTIAGMIPEGEAEEASFDTLRQVLQEAQQDGDFRDAWDIFEDSIRDGEATAKHGNYMIQACHTSKQLRRLTNNMLDADLVPSVDVYNYVLARLLFEDRTDQAAAVLDEMELLGVDCNSLTSVLLDEIRRF